MISPLSTGIIKSNKILENSGLQKILFKYIKTTNKTVNEQKNGNLFLGKKTKIFFNVNKNCKKNSFLSLIKLKKN